METLSFQQQIIDKHEFLGSISNGKEIVDNLHIILQYPLTSQGKITGKIIGAKEIFDKVFKLFDDTSGIYSFQLNCTYQTIAENPLLLSINSQHVRVQPIGKSPEHSELPSLTSAKMLEFDQFMNSLIMTYEIAELECEDLQIITTHASIENFPIRRLSFFLAGSSKNWLRNPEGIEFSSFTGEIKHTFKKFNIDLSNIFPYNIEVLPRFFHQKLNGKSVITNVPVLQIITEESEQNLSNEQFIKSGVEIVNNLEILLSFIHKRWTTWYQYELQTKDTEKIYRRVIRECLTEPDELGSLVSDKEIEKFLKVGYENLEKLRKEGFNLSMPIKYFIAGYEARHIEEEFSITFLAFEKLKDLFAEQENCRLNLPKEMFNKFRKKTNLSKLIEETIFMLLRQRQEEEEKIHATAQNIKAKIPDLNHPPLQNVIEKLLAKYGLDWRELYPPSQNKLTLINTRDRLFHTSEEREGMFLLEETERLQAIVGRLLLRMLGWHDISCCPRKDLLAILTNER